MGNISVESPGNQPKLGFQSLLVKLFPDKKDEPPPPSVHSREVAFFLKPEREHPILERIGRVPLNEYYVVGWSIGTPVRIKSMDQAFISTFLGEMGMVEESRPPRLLLSSRIMRRVSGHQLAVLFGGNARVLTTLSEIFVLMWRQVFVEQGKILLANRYPNVFLVRDVRGQIHAVAVRWCGDGWDLSIPQNSYHYRWRIGSRVFSVMLK